MYPNRDQLHELPETGVPGPGYGNKVHRWAQKPDPTSPQGRQTNIVAQKMFSIGGWHVITLFLCFVKVLRLATGFSHGPASQTSKGTTKNFKHTLETKG